MMPIMEKGREAKTVGHRRMDPEEPLHLGEAQAARGMTGVVSVATETEAVAREEEVIDEVTVLTRGPLNDVTLIEPDVMVDSRRGTTTSRGTIRGRSHADSARSSGPHWPREETGSIAARDLLPLRIR